MSPQRLFHCMECKRLFPIEKLDGKPERFAGKKNTSMKALAEALMDNENCERLECADCYGPGYCEAP